MDIKTKFAEILQFFKLAPNRRERFIKVLKIWLFHSTFTFIVLLYLTVGAAVLAMMEKSPEILKRQQKLDRILQLRQNILDHATKSCHEEKMATLEAAESELKPLLQELSFAHEYDDRFSLDRQKWTSDSKMLTPLWTFYASVLYALTVLTATGYDRLSPETDAGRLFAIGFGLFGIPLMFITAANIGKFLSRMVTLSYRTFGKQYRRGIAHIQSRRLSMNPPQAALNRLSSIRQSIYGLWFVNSNQNQAPGTQPQIQISGAGNSQFDPEFEYQVPVIVVLALIAGYCSLGSWLFTSFESGPVWTFLYGFCFSFNTITTVTLGDIRVDDVLYLALVVAYCIVGLAVITMCVDLVSVRLKILFTKLHYYGRKWALLRARDRSKSRRVNRVVNEAAAMATMIREYRESVLGPMAERGHKLSSCCESSTRKPSDSIGEVREMQSVIEEALRPTYMPRNIDAIPWVDSEDDTSTSAQSMEAYGSQYL